MWTLTITSTIIVLETILDVGVKTNVILIISSKNTTKGIVTIPANTIVILDGRGEGYIMGVVIKCTKSTKVRHWKIKMKLHKRSKVECYMNRGQRKCVKDNMG